MSHYFTTPSGPEHRRTVRARFWDTDWEFDSADGVFSANGLDLGTSVLLRESVPRPGAGRLLDLGCGFGVLAVALATACPGAEVDAVDVNERALALTAANAVRHDVAARVHPSLPQDVDPDLRYDEIWSNPPIRIGKEALHALLLTWLPRLAPGGVARLVVSRNLGGDSLQRWLIEQGYPCTRQASAKGFRVLLVDPSVTAGDEHPRLKAEHPVPTERNPMSETPSPDKGAFLDKVKEFAEDAIENVKEFTGEAVDTIKEFAGSATEQVKDFAEDLPGNAKKLADDASTVVKGFAGGVADKVSDLKGDHAGSAPLPDDIADPAADPTPEGTWTNQAPTTEDGIGTPKA